MSRGKAVSIRWLAPLLTLLLLAFAGNARAGLQSNFRRCSYNSTFAQVANPPNLADMATQQGVSWGVSLNDSVQTIDEYSAAIQKRPELVNIFLNMTNASITSVAVDCQVASIRAAGAAMMLTLEPWTGLDNINATTLSALFDLCSQANLQGVPILLRFAQEMNGDWYPWGSSPTLYTTAFRQVATALKPLANMTQMLWAPNTAVGYPFITSGGFGPQDTSDPQSDPRFAQMDTNDNGVLDPGDDPYTPYYPGDDVVDWVGVSLYSKRNMAVSEDMANVQNTRANVSFWITDGTAGFNLYQNFSATRNKPFMIAETGAAYYPEYPDGDGAVLLKQTWWDLLWATETQTLYPNMKAAMWFEYIKTSTDSDEVLDYAITYNQTILTPFLADTTTANTNVLFLGLSDATALATPTAAPTTTITPIATVTQLTSIPLVAASSTSTIIRQPSNDGSGGSSTHNSGDVGDTGDSTSGYNSTGPHLGTKTVAMAVAIPVGVIFLFAMAGLLCRRRKRRTPLMPLRQESQSPVDFDDK